MTTWTGTAGLQGMKRGSGEVLRDSGRMDLGQLGLALLLDWTAVHVQCDSNLDLQSGLTAHEQWKR